MMVPEWLVTPFDMMIDNKGYEFYKMKVLKCMRTSKLRRC